MKTKFVLWITFICILSIMFVIGGSDELGLLRDIACFIAAITVFVATVRHITASKGRASKLRRIFHLGL